MSDDLKGRIDLDVSGATNALEKARKAFRDLSNASTDAGKQMTAAQLNATKQIIASYERLRNAQSKVVSDALSLNRKLKEIELKGVADRAATRAKTSVTTSVGAATTNAITTKSANGTLVAQNQAELLSAKKITEERRQQVMLADAAARRANEGIKNELALRKQVFREQQVANRAQGDAVVGLNGMRYVLADVAQSMRMVGIAALALPVAAGITAIAWEKDFASVIRTVGVTGDSVGETTAKVAALKGQFTQLVQTMPVSFEKLAEIGTLAGQLGILEGQVGRFTKTVAMFSATTDVSVGDSATAFGRLNALLPDVQGNFTALGDSILKVGVNSVATEGQIIRISTQIAAIVGPSGYAADQVIGLAGALASVGVPPELSRGVITRVFGQINKATINGGVSLEKWGHAMGMSGEQFRTSWNTDAAGTFQKIMGVLNDNGSAAALTLNNLGITSVRDVPILMRLAGALDANGKAFDSATGKGGLLVQTMKDAANATGEMQKQYNIISGTTAAKLQVFVQSFQALIDAVGSKALPAFSSILDGWTDSLHNLTRSLDEPLKLFGLFSTGISQGDGLAVTAVILGVIGGLALLVAAMTRVVSAALAMKLAISSVSTDMAAAGLASVKTAAQIDAAALASQSFSAKTSLASKAATGFRGALSLIGSSGVLALLIALPFAIDALNKSFDDVGSSAKEMSFNIIHAKDSMELLKNTQIGKGGTGNPWESMSAGTKDFAKQLEALDAKSKGAFSLDTRKFEVMRQGTATIDKLSAGYSELIAAGNQNVVFASVQGLVKDLDLSDAAIRRLLYNSQPLNALFKDTLSAAGIKPTEAALIDLAKNGLEGVGIAAEGAASGGAAFNEEISAAEQAISDFIGAAAGGDAAFISVSGAMDGVIEKNKAVAESTAAATESSDDSWETYYDGFSFNLADYLVELESMVAAQGEWEANMTSLAGKVSSDTLAELGKLGPEAAPLVAQLATATQPELDRFEAAFTQGGADASSGFASGLQSRSDFIGQVGAALGETAKQNLITELGAAGADVDAIMADYKRRIENTKPQVAVKTDSAERQVTGFIEQQQMRGIRLTVTADASAARAAIQGVRDQAGRPINQGQFSTGGYTGMGAKMAPAGIVHKGEFVMTKQATERIGVGNLYGMMNAAQRGYSTGGAVATSSNSYVQSTGGMSTRSGGMNGGIQIVDLSAQAIQALANALNLQVIIPGAAIAKATSNSNINSSGRRNA